MIGPGELRGRPREIAARGFCAACFRGIGAAGDDFFDIDDRIVHDDPDGDDEAGQDHRVEGGSGKTKYQGRRHERERDRQRGNQGGPPLEEEGEENDDQGEEAKDERGA